MCLSNYSTLFDKGVAAEVGGDDRVGKSRSKRRSTRRTELIIRSACESVVIEKLERARTRRSL